MTISGKIRVIEKKALKIYLLNEQQIVELGSPQGLHLFRACKIVA